MKSSAPTMKDVAREAGVALGTVSKVINGIPVGESYRIRVEDAAKKLGYQVNQYARGLKTNKTGVVGVILPNVTHPYWAALAQHICTSLEARDCRMMLFVTDSCYEREQECIRLVRQNKADGIIALTYSRLELGDDIPFISIDRYFGARVPCVASDNYGGGALAAEKLIELGCKRLLFVRTGSAVSGEADKRGDGFADTCKALGKPCDVLKFNHVDSMGPFREFFMAHMNGGLLDYDGIFCSTDLLAVNIREVLEQLGLKVPQDVQLIGFDGLVRFDTGRYFCSTIVQPTEKIAKTCVDMLLNEDRSSVPSLVCLPVSYAPGGTTKEGI